MDSPTVDDRHEKEGLGGWRIHRRKTSVRDAYLSLISVVSRLRAEASLRTGGRYFFIRYQCYERRRLGCYYKLAKPSRPRGRPARHTLRIYLCIQIRQVYRSQKCPFSECLRYLRRLPRARRASLSIYPPVRSPAPFLSTKSRSPRDREA